MIHKRNVFETKKAMVNVAQMVERQTVALVAVGSIPTIHPKSSLKCCNVLKNTVHWSQCRDVAQLVAHSLWERGVASSSLAIPTIFLSTPYFYHLSPNIKSLCAKKTQIIAI